VSALWRRGESRARRHPAGAKRGPCPAATQGAGGGDHARAGADAADVLKNPVITDLAAKYGKTPAQVVLRWHLDGRSALPKSVTPSRIAQNIDVFDFTLESGELTAIDALDTGLRGGPDPELLNTRTFPQTIDNS